jgi:hypothetical protein
LIEPGEGNFAAVEVCWPGGVKKKPTKKNPKERPPRPRVDGATDTAAGDKPPPYGEA